MGVIADAGGDSGRASLYGIFAARAAGAPRLRTLEEALRRATVPLVSVRASGDAGHDDGCRRDHLIPGVCVSVGEEASDGQG